MRMFGQASTCHSLFYYHFAVVVVGVIVCGCGNNDAPHEGTFRQKVQTKELGRNIDKRKPCDLQARDLDVISAVLSEKASFHPDDRRVLHSPTLNLAQISAEHDWIRSINNRIAKIGGERLLDSFTLRNRTRCNLTNHSFAQHEFVLHEGEFPSKDFTGDTVDDIVAAGAKEVQRPQTLHVSVTMPAYSDSGAVAVVYVIHRLRNVFGSFREELLILKRLGKPSQWHVVEHQTLTFE